MGSLFGGAARRRRPRRHAGRRLEGARRRDQSRRPADRRPRRRSHDPRRCDARSASARPRPTSSCSSARPSRTRRPRARCGTSSTASTAVISFQNGLGNEETLGRILGAEHVLGGLTAQGAVVVEAGRGPQFRRSAELHRRIRGAASPSARSAIADAFTRHRLPTFASADIKKEKWQKLLGNVALGAVSAATDMTSAEMVAIPELRTVILRALDETAAVARACGIAARRRREARDLRQAHDRRRRRHGRQQVVDGGRHRAASARPRSTRFTGRCPVSAARRACPRRRSTR